jgi:hypothetical protein
MAKGTGIDEALQQIGLAIGRHIAEGIQEALAGGRAGGSVPARRGPGRPPKAATAAGRPTKRGPGRPRRTDAEAACLVPGCGKRSVAKKLCPTHYRKASRLHYGDNLSAAQLANLAADGRATRWKKGKKTRR